MRFLIKSNHYHNLSLSIKKIKSKINDILNLRRLKKKQKITISRKLNESFITQKVI